MFFLDTTKNFLKLGIEQFFDVYQPSSLNVCILSHVIRAHQKTELDFHIFHIRIFAQKKCRCPGYNRRGHGSAAFYRIHPLILFLPKSVAGTDIGSGSYQIRLADEDCYKKITVKSDDANLVQLCATLNAYKDIQITYVFGSSRETLDGLELVKWVTGTNGTEIQVDRDKAVAYVKSLADKYDTYGNHKYKTTSGRDVVVYGKYGWKINQTAETDALVEAVKACQTTEREPIYESRGATHDGYDFGQTYIEVDLATQHLYFYKDGKVIIDSPFVSGNVSKNYTTPPGLFELYYKQKDRVLKGEDYAAPVKYWMPFNGGIGLHDADWRSKFGGTIYQTNGSHGCINLPPKVAAQVYENAYKGIPIICCN